MFILVEQNVMKMNTDVLYRTILALNNEVEN